MKLQYSLDELDQVVSQILDLRNGVHVLAFKGDLGAGKTTLIRAICRYLGVAETAVSSPTFSIINEYLLPEGQAFQKIYHMDWYRLSSEEEGYQAGVEDALHAPAALCFIEWPEQAPGLLTVPHLLVQLQKEPAHDRRRTLEIQLVKHL